MTALTLDDFDPFALPTRKWDLANEIVDDGPQRPDCDDPAVQAAVVFLEQIQAEKVTGLPPEDSLLGAAHRIYQDGGALRWEIEARLVAGESDQQIAVRCDVPPDVIGRYEGTFFNVRYCLKAWGYLLNQVVGEGVHRGFEDDEVSNLWAWIALGGGPLVLDAVVQAFRAAMKPGEPLTLSTFLRADAGIDPRIQALVASAVLPPYGPSGIVWVETRRLLLDADAAIDEDRRALLLERAQKHVVHCALAVLALKPLPRLKGSSRGPKERTPAGGKVDDAKGCGTTVKDVLLHTISSAMGDNTPTNYDNLPHPVPRSPGAIAEDGTGI
jgi:hypothetical protein